MLLAVILVPLLHQQAQAQTLIANYPMNATANDASGNGHHGLVYGATPTTDQNGTSNEAYYFDGTPSDYVEYTAANWSFFQGFPVTIMAWVRKDVTSPNRSFLVFGNNYEENDYNGFWLNISASNRVTGAFGDGGEVSINHRRSKSGATPLTAGQWHHVAVVIKGPTDMEVYLDGINDCGTYSGNGGNISYHLSLEGSTARSDLTAGNGGLNFGHGAVSEIQFYKGILKQPEIWISPMAMRRIL